MRPRVVDRLAAGSAFADLSSWRKILLTGVDAARWLNDLVSADLSDIGPGRARHALLLSRTGGVRGGFAVCWWNGSLLLLQDPVQPSIGELLEAYVLSSEVELEDRTGHLSLFALPGRSEPPDAPGAVVSCPSCLGGRGLDLILPSEGHGAAISALRRTFEEAEPGEVEAWRVVHGLPRIGVDVLEGDLPQEAGLGFAVARDKGCYVGQEAIAKVENLGHPRRVLVSFTAAGAVSIGERVLADGADAGRITSAVPMNGVTYGLASIGWSARARHLHTTGGIELRAVTG